MLGYLTINEIAQKFERHQDTVARWLAEGRLPGLPLRNGAVVVPMTALWPHRQVSESDE